MVVGVLLVKPFFMRERSLLSLFLCSGHMVTGLKLECLPTQKGAMFNSRAQGGSSQCLNTLPSLYGHHPKPARERGMNICFLQSLCIKSKVPQCKCGEPGFETQSVSTSPGKSLPNKHFPPAKSPRFAGHLMIKTTWLSGSHASSTVVLSLTYCGWNLNIVFQINAHFISRKHLEWAIAPSRGLFIIGP